MIGHSADRIDGPAKVTGRALYAYERRLAEPAAFGVMVGATIAKGRIRQIDTAAAERVTGVLLVMTHRNAPPQAARQPRAPGRPFGRPWPVLDSDQVTFFGQPIALVVAETFEQARAAALLVAADYMKEAGRFDLATHQGHAYAPTSAYGGMATDSARGDLAQAMATAAVTVDETYSTPHQFAQPMEPQACLANWQGEDLMVRTSVQIVAAARECLAATLQMPPERVHVDSAFVGGGFGAKLRVHEETVLAAIASRQLGRPVKVAQTRRQVFNVAGHRTEMIHRVRLAANADGRLTGVGHDVNMQGHSREHYVEQVATVMRSLYAAPSRLTRHRVTDLDVSMGEAVRGPGEVPGLLVIESAMDGLAHKLSLDPIELRVRNEPARDPERDVPFSDRRLVDCMREGAARFGWADRPTAPGRRRDSDRLVGYGMAAAIRTHFQGATTVGVRMDADGRVMVRSDMTDLGTGTYTILAQVASEALGVPIERVEVELARTGLPVSSGSGGSYGAANSSVALHRACEAFRAKALGPAGVSDQSRDLVAEVARRFPDGLEAEGSIAGMGDDPNYKAYSLHTYGATFAEVGVDAVTGEVRLSRMLGVFAAGRIVNPKTARSQLIGGMIWGVSSALHEGAFVDPHHGNFVNGDLAEYLVPVHADIPAIEAVFLDDFAEKANPLGIKGVGELGVCGSGAAVANAVFNATGVRILDFPITPEKLLSALPGGA